MRTLCGTILAAAVAFVAAATPDPQTAFENPPLSARTGVWWRRLPSPTAAPRNWGETPETVVILA